MNGAPPDAHDPQAGQDLARDSMRRTLHNATSAHRARLDRSLSVLKLADRSGYGLFLNIHYSALSALARHWGARDHADFSGMLRGVTSDLQNLGYRIDLPEVVTDEPPDLAMQWGVAYVIRCYRLGAYALGASLPMLHPSAYLNFAPALAWRDFQQQLDAAADAMTPEEKARVVAGALVGVAAFSDAAGVPT